jgi:hypothetical protein
MAFIGISVSGNAPEMQTIKNNRDPDHSHQYETDHIQICPFGRPCGCRAPCAAGIWSGFTHDHNDTICNAGKTSGLGNGLRREHHRWSASHRQRHRKGTITSGVQIWVFAGNYVNVNTVPVSADGTFSKTYNTTGLPPATYYVFVQYPGADDNLEIMTKGYSGQVTNMDTGAVIFNFTGMGSVKDDAAAIALANALNEPGINDVYTKALFVISGSPAATAIMPGSDRDSHGCIGSAGYTWCEAKQKCLRTWEEPCIDGSAVPLGTTAAPAATKSLLSPLPAIVGFAFACCAAGYYWKN